MSDLTPEDRALLDLARGGHDPGPDDRSRVRTAIAAQLGMAAGLMSSSAGAGGGSVAAGVLSGAGSVALKVIAAAAIVGTLCAGGAAAYRALETRPPAPKAATSGVVQAPAPFAQAPLAKTVLLAAPPAVIAAVPAEALPSSSSPLAAAQIDRTRERTGRTAGAPATPGVNPPFNARTEGNPAATSAESFDTAPTGLLAPARSESEPAPTALAPILPTRTGAVLSPPPTTLLAETELIRAGLASLHGGDPVHALALFDQHAREFPGGVLADERDVERITALCDLGRSADARAAASSFLRRRATAPLAGRVLSSCGNPSRSIP